MASGSGAITVVLCNDKCARRKRKGKAAQRCVTCEKKLCDTCVRQHDPSLGDHSLVKLGATEGEHKEKCSRHPNEVINQWCKTHGCLACSTCIASKHSNCQYVAISEQTYATLPESSNDKVICDIQSCLEELESIKKANTGGLKRIDIDTSTSVESIKYFRNRLVKLLDVCTESTVSEIERNGKVMSNEIGESLKSVDRSMNEFDELKNSLQVGNEDKVQEFITLKKCEERLSSAMDAHLRKKESGTELGFEFKLFPKIEEFPQIVWQFGAVKPRQTLQDEELLYKVKGVITVDCESDCIRDCCMIGDGTAVVTDGTHDLLRRVDLSSGSLLGRCKLPGKPYGVCKTGPNEVVVCLETQTLQFVAVENEMILMRSLLLEQRCTNVAYENGELFVANGGKDMFIYNVEGELLETLNKTPDGVDLFSSIWQVVVSKDGGHIFVTDGMKGIVGIKRDGTELFCLKVWRLTTPYPICTDRSGCIFVAGNRSDNVMQLRENGRLVGEMLTKGDGIKGPTSMCVDAQRKHFFVAGYQSSHLLIYDVI